jgi:hypothetical protein
MPKEVETQVVRDRDRVNENLLISKPFKTGSKI